MNSVNVVWFKRDLRIEDHPALSDASRDGTVLPIYIFEPELWRQPDISERHFRFLKTSLLDLNESLSALGQPLYLMVGDALDCLNQLKTQFHIKALYSHQETWNGWTYERDKAVLNWCTSLGIDWHEPPQNGIIRRLKDRDGWSRHWYKFMSLPLRSAPASLPFVADSEVSVLSLTFCSETTPLPAKREQPGGRTAALHVLHSFLHERGEHYTKAMSSPVTAPDACSRLSPYLAFGCLSLREAFQMAQNRSQDLTLNKTR